MGENIRVAVRLRPLLASESQRHAEVHWTSDANKICHVESSSKEICSTYCFDKVFSGNADNRTVFKEMVEPLIESAMKGFNVTIFAYGQTASGKTYTMTGSPQEHGMTQLAVQQIFASIENTPEREFLLRVSYIEIYNEQLNDLLAREKKPLKIQEQGQNNVQVVNLIEREVNSFTSVLDWMAQGDRQRRVGFTNMNERSSRSHAIFRIIVESRLVNSQDEGVQVSHINLVDLAGSEKSYQANTTGERFREGCAINQSLSTLSLVIKQLSDGEEFANFRDSKLTHLLRSSLGGNALTAIICAVTPCAFEETKSTLNFATRAKKVCNKAEVNEILSEQALLKRYLNQIRDLETKLKAKDTQEQAAEVGEDLRRILEEKDLKIRELNEKLVVSSHRCLAEEESTELTREMRRMTWGGYRLETLQPFAASRGGRKRATELKIQPVSFLNETTTSAIDNTFQEDGFVDAAKFFNPSPPKPSYVDVGVNTEACDSPVKKFPSTPAPLLRKRANDLEQQLESEKTTRVEMETTYNELLEFTRIENSEGIGGNKAAEDTLRAELQQANDRLEQLEKEAAELRQMNEKSADLLRVAQENSSLSANVGKLTSLVAKLEKDKEDSELAHKIRIEQHLAIEAELRRALEDAWKVKHNQPPMDESICLPINGGAAAAVGFSLADELRALEEDVTVSAPAFSRKKRPSSMLSETLARMDASTLADDNPSEAKMRRLSDVDEAEDPNEELERIRMQLAGLQSVLLEQEQEYDRLVQRNSDLEHRFIQAETSEVVHNLEGKIKDLETELESLQRENERLSDRLSAAEAEKNVLMESEETKPLEAKVLDLERQIADLRDSLVLKEAEVEAFNLEKSKFTDDFHHVKCELQQAQDQLEQAWIVRESLQEQLSSAADQKQELQVQLESLQTKCEVDHKEYAEELEKKVSQLESEVRASFLQQISTLKEKLQTVSMQMQEKEMDIETLTLEKERCIEQMEAVEARLAEIAKLEQQLASVTAEKEALMAAAGSSESEQQSLVVEELQSKIAQLESEKAEHLQQLEEHEAAMETLVLDKEKYIQENESLKAEVDKVAALQDQVTSLTAEKEALLAEASLARSREAAESEQQLLIQDLQKRLDEVKNEKAGLLEQLEKQEGNIHDLLVEKEKQNQELDVLKSQLDQFAEVQDRLTSITAEKEALLAELDLARSREIVEKEKDLLIDDLRTKLLDLENDKASSMQDAQNLEAEKLSLETQLQTTESDLNALLAEKGRLDAEVETLKIQLANIQQENEEAEKVRADYEEVKCRLVEVEELQNALASLQAEKEALIADSEVQRAQQEAMQEELQSSIDNLTNKIMELEKDKEDTSSTVGQLSEEIHRLNFKADSLAVQLTEKELEIQQFITEKDNYAREVSDLRLDIQRATDAHEKDQDQVNDLRNDLETVRSEKDLLFTELSELRSRQSAFELIETERGNLKEAVIILSEKLQEASSQTGRLETLLQDKESELAALRQEGQEMEERTSSIGEENNSLRNELLQIRAQLEALEVQRDDLMTKLKESCENASQLLDLKQKADELDKLQQQFDAFESRHGKRLGSRLAGFYNCFVALENKLQLAQEQLKTEKANHQKQISSLDTEVERCKSEIRRLRSKISQSSTPVLSSVKSGSSSSSQQSTSTSVVVQTDPIPFTGAGSLRWQMDSYQADNQRLRRKCEDLHESYENVKGKLMKYYNLYLEAVGKPDKMIKTHEESPVTAAAPENPAVPVKTAPEVAPVLKEEALPLTKALGDTPLAPLDPLNNKQQSAVEQKLPPPPECKTS